MTPEQPPDPANHAYPPGPINLSPTAELTALAAHLRRLADRVDHVDSRADELSDALTGLVLPQLAELRKDTADQLAEHTAQVQQLIDTVAANTGGPVDWPAMDAERAATEWDALARWIDHTLVPWFEITRDQLPDCWALHRPAVLELAWLHIAYQAAYQAGAPPHLAAEWHTRWKPAALRSIHDAIPRRGARVCGPGQHLASEADRVRRHPMGGRPPDASVEPTSLPTEQLAERRHWRPFYEQAVDADLAIRRERFRGERC
ncbi:MAG: hypothetical protein ACT4O0_05135 [Pseudonocardia sp.]